MSDHTGTFGFFNHPRFYDRMNRVLRFRPLYTRAVADIAQAGLPDGSRVLDAGTGPGRVPIELARRCPELHIEGLDLSTEMIAYARRIAGPASPVRFTAGDVAELPYRDDTFDLIVATMSQHHWADAPAGMRELSRTLRPAGQVWIYDFRFFLRRAERAARTAFSEHTFQREPISALVGRLVIRPA
jgi:ubiquinone/menaquinone biosynthesis C-methylase UbiE